MGLIQAAKAFLRQQYTGSGMREAPTSAAPRSQSGIALFMVIASVSVLSIVVTEFTYIAQVNQKIAFDGLDQLQAHYLAKTGLKISLLRLKAYQHITKYVETMTKGAGAAGKNLVPKGLLDKIWSIPFHYPFSNLPIPGMTPAERDKIKEFEKASNLQGKFSAYIESESGKYNLNLLLEGFVPTPNPSASPSPTPGAGNQGSTGSTSNTGQKFDSKEAQLALKNYLAELMRPKMEDDPTWADAYRDPHLLEDLVDNIAAWADRKHERRSQTGDLPMKGAPFYSVSELHMIPGMDDDLYNLFAPNLTVVRTQGININTLEKPTLKALFPLAVDEELTDFFKIRDSEEEDGKFKDEEGFFKYIKEHFAAYQRGTAFDQVKEGFTKNHIRFVTEETEYKITVRAEVNQSTRLIEAWLTLGSTTQAKGPTTNPTSTNPGGGVNNPPQGAPTAPPAAPDAGMKIHFMRVL